MSFSGIIRSILLSFTLMAGFLASPLAQALTQKQADDLLSTLHKMSVDSYLAINAYYSFANSGGDKSVAQEANNTINRIDSLLDQLNKAPGAEEVQENLTALSTQWEQYRKLLIANMQDLIKRGYPDLRLMVDMSQANVDFIGGLGDTASTIKKSSGYQPNELLELVREATLKIEQIMTAYAARSASNVSQIAQGAETDEPLNVLAEQFTQQLQALKTKTVANQEAAKVVDDIATKWNFIKSSYVNFNENNVAYIANLYSKRIIEGLQSLESTSQL